MSGDYIMNERYYLNEEWKYDRIFDESIKNDSYSSSTIEEIRIPHTNVEMPFHYFDDAVYQFVSGYRRVLNAPSEWEGKSVTLTFDGVAHDSTVYLNGEEIVSHHCGYTAFFAEIGDKLKYGQDNIIAVRVDSRENLNVPPFGFVIDYMTYGGIYRDVYIDVKNKCHMNNLYVHPDVTPVNGIGTKASLSVSFELSAEVPAGAKSVISICRNGQDEYKKLADTEIASMERKARDSQVVYKTKTVVGENVDLWSPKTPNLYLVKTTILDGDNILDETVTRIGFRTAVFTEEGFFLNGNKFKIRGLNRHQSYPYVGYAMPKSMQEMDAEVLKNELGLNAVRTSHYPQSHYFIDKCDEIGLLVFTEMPGWQHIGDEDWKLQAIQNTEDMILQWRNHTSIILWGVRINESVDDDSFYERTNAKARGLDPYRPTGGVRCIKKSNLLEDVYTYNDFTHDGKAPGCTPKDKVTSNMKKGYLVSEYNGHMYPTKSYDDELHRTEHALRHVRVLDAVGSQSNIAGSFGWCMADYNTHKDFGSGDRICYHGVLDMFRNAKPAAYVYSAQQDEKPMLYVCSSMDIGEHPGGMRDELWAFSNADSIKMYKNDKFISEYKVSDSEYKNMVHGPVLMDDFVGDQLETIEHMKPKVANDVKKGLNMVARYGMTSPPKAFYPLAAKIMTVYHISYDRVVELFNEYIGNWGGEATVHRFDAIKDGQVVASVTKAPFDKVVLDADAYKTELVEDKTYDVTEVRIRALDQNGNVLACYNDPVVLSIKGDAEIIGGNIVNLQGGMAGTYIKTKGVDGEATLTIEGIHTEPVSVTFSIRKNK